jgi:NarL family two-component system response regulator LiaR
MSDENRPIRVLVADDHSIVRSGLAAFLEAYSDLELVGQASDGEQAIRLCRELAPDVVLMDLVMPGVDGIAATRAITAMNADIQVIALTSFSADDLVARALQAGAISYLMKNVSHAELAAAIRAAVAGRATLAPEATQAIIRKVTQPPPPGADLTAREREVLRLMVAGMSNLQIAARLTVTQSTAKSHVSNIISKLGVSSRTEAVALALRHHLVD